MSLKRLQDMNVKGKRVLLRLDLNVPFGEDGVITETTRIDRVKPTIDWLRGHGARTVVMAHLGRPNGADEALSTRKLIDDCTRLWGCPVAFGTSADARHDGDVVIMENIRFDAREEKNDPEFARELAAQGDLYVNDAFSVSHRAHASTEALAHLLPSAAGLSMQAELDALNASVKTPKKPVTAIIGGSKVSTKIAVLAQLVQTMDTLIIGGGMANTFLLARGEPIGDSLAERAMTETAQTIMDTAAKHKCRIVLPSDVTATLSLDAPTDIYHGTLSDMPSDYRIVDVGPDSVKDIESVISSSKTVLWNGPVGVFEKPPFDRGTTAIARAIADGVKNKGLIAVAGGGDTLAAIEAAGLSESQFTYLSTAGGAFLEWLEGKDLPGVSALMA